MKAGEGNTEGLLGGDKTVKETLQEASKDKDLLGKVSFQII